MGREMDKLRAERRAERSADPHAWAEGIERNDAWRTMMVGLCALSVAGLGWYVHELKKEQDLMRAQIDNLQVNTLPVAYGTPAYYSDPNYEPPPPPPGFEVVP